MLEYFTYKKVKKNQTDKEKGKGKTQVDVEEKPEPLLSPDDENFLGKIISAEGTPPPLPDRPAWVLNPEAGDSVGNDQQMVVHKTRSNERRKSSSHQRRKSSSKERKKSLDKGKGKARENEKDKRAIKSGVFSFFQKKAKDGLEPKKNVPTPEAENETEDISRILDNLNLSAANNRAFSLSKESQKLVKEFTVILKDLVNGAPTAYDDLVRLLNDSQGTLAKSYSHLPPFLQKLITTLPNKLTSTLAPELLAVATEAQTNLNGGEPVMGTASIDNAGGLKGAAKGLIGSVGLKELVTKPGAVVRLLKAIMNALKVRWPAFMGTNVLLSLALFVLLFVFWYCHKRGRETRLEREGKTIIIDSDGRITELDDDPMLPGPTMTSLAANESGIEGGVPGPSTRIREEARSETRSGSSGSGSGRSRRDDRERRRSRMDGDDDRKEGRSSRRHSVDDRREKRRSRRGSDDGYDRRERRS